LIALSPFIIGIIVFLIHPVLRGKLRRILGSAHDFVQNCPSAKNQDVKIDIDHIQTPGSVDNGVEPNHEAPPHQPGNATYRIYPCVINFTFSTIYFMMPSTFWIWLGFCLTIIQVLYIESSSVCCYVFVVGDYEQRNFSLNLSFIFFSSYIYTLLLMSVFNILCCSEVKRFHSLYI